MHKNNIIYRDLKPENILLDKDGHIRMTDFGLSKGGMGAGVHTETFCGTPEYLAPEIVRGEPHAKDVDWWSLGILMFEMLAGVPPFYSENVHLMYKLIETAPVRFPATMSPLVTDLVVKLLAREPKQRLGHTAADVEEIKAHPWFGAVPNASPPMEKLDWVKLEAKQLPAPYKPKVSHEGDISYVDSCFTNEPVVQSKEVVTAEAKAADFGGFSYAKKSAQAGAAAPPAPPMNP